MKNKFSKTVVMMVLMGTLLVALVPVSQVFAQDEELPQEITAEEDERGAGVTRFFEGVVRRMYAYQKSMAAYLDNTLAYSDRYVEQAQSRISELQQEGQDTTILEDVLDQFYTFTSEAEQALDAANALLSVQTGFDEDGTVLDLEAARDTVLTLEEHVSTARSSIAAAILAVMEGLQQYRETLPVEE